MKFLDYLEWKYKRNVNHENPGNAAKACDLSLDPDLKAEISDADLFSDDSNLWNACRDEVSLD